ncbi:putative dehydrogenase [Rhizobium leguminosarum bv. trifolii WSM597]|uniref:Putative dehydrogenase n=1 Tax=Rhizobium leguminosarum bv. trifolii WSM597 TaxID=754764 RepID=I9NJY2_RHILT|nr:Gfo/Idh/MocA family oxidoreductase [Rhizobium leguminosarum]EJB07052.1 putative dehydrogenase [Rhizobium leguminosarum bv. trifolii WSM597]
MRLGLVGYGTGGRHFHAPYISAADGIQLVGVVARAPQTVARVGEDLPGVPVHASLADMIKAGGIDAVTISTPPQTRRELVLEAIAAGLHVVADKPFAPSAAVARELGEAAERAGVVLAVYHNRRFDADVLTLKKVIESGELGELWRIHSRMEFDDPATLEGGPTGGLLRDLGSHLVDQMLWLLGPVRSVSAYWDMAHTAEGRTDAGFVLNLQHALGVHSHLSASKLNRLTVREFRAYGEHGSYVSSGTDVQTQAIFSGSRPADDLKGWGYEKPELWGTLRTRGKETRIPSEQGRYHWYYESFLRAVQGHGPAPVTVEEATATLAILDAARVSAMEGRTVDV